MLQSKCKPPHIHTYIQLRFIEITIGLYRYMRLRTQFECQTQLLSSNTCQKAGGYCGKLGESATRLTKPRIYHEGFTSATISPLHTNQALGAELCARAACVTISIQCKRSRCSVCTHKANRFSVFNYEFLVNRVYFMCFAEYFS